MARPREFSRNQVLQEAVKVFWEQGYEATSIADLTQRTGLSRSSIYQAFGSKRGLFNESLRHYVEVHIGSMLHDLETGDRGLAAISGFFTHMAEATDDPEIDGQLGCLMVNTIAELTWRDEAIRPAADAYRKRLQAGFDKALRRAERLEEIPPGDHDPRARLLATLALGAFILARGNPNHDDTRLLADAVIDEIQTWRIPTRIRS